MFGKRAAPESQPPENTRGSEQFGVIPHFPHDVRYALQYQKAQLKRKHIEQLHRNGFPLVAFYFMMKAAEDNDTAQKALLERVAELKFDAAGLRRDEKPVTDTLDHLADGAVPGSKLGAVSRYGMETGWLKYFERTLEPTVKPETQLFMLGHSPYIGLSVLADYSLNRGQPLGILKPSRFDQTELPVGFLLTPNQDGTTVEPLGHDFDRPGHALLFDDVSRTGGTAQRAFNFWLREPSDEIPDFAFNVRLHNRRPGDDAISI